MPADLHASRLLDGAQVAALLGVCPRQVHYMADDGRLGPQPVRLGRSVRWRADELLRWIDAGCPGADAWAHMGRRRGR